MARLTTKRPTTKRTRRVVQQDDTPVAPDLPKQEPESVPNPPLKPGGEEVLQNIKEGIETIGNPSQWKILSQTNDITTLAMEIELNVGCLVAVSTPNGVATQFIPNVVIHSDINGGYKLGKRIRRNSMR